MAQISLALQYKDLLASGKQLPSFDDIQFRVHSQNGEDGIIWYIFSLIGTTNKRVVEMCAADGAQCNSANLILNHGWDALLLDGDENFVKNGIQYFKRNPDSSWSPPVFKHAWITKDNVNDILKSAGYDGDLDLFSLDMDGVDYWIWDAIDCINPRVVVTECQIVWGPEEAVTIPYQESFQAELVNGGVEYGGASIAAFVKLAKKKGYRLIGCERYGFNAFFLRNDIAQDIFPEVGPEVCFNHVSARKCVEERLPRVKDREWVRV